MKKHIDTKVAALGACAALLLGFAACSSSNSTDVPGTGGQGASTATGGSGGQAATGCPGSQLECNKQCFDGNVDPTNCGSCGTACSAGEVCNAGSCALSCSPGTTDCSGGCVDQNVDPNNCGACDKACAGGEVCSAGVCTTTCAAGLIVCDGKCTDPLTDKGYCGAAGDCTTAAAGGSGGTGGTGGAAGGTGGAGGAAGGAGGAGGGATAPANSAGESCTGDDICNGSGVCELSCQTGFIDCNGTCTDPNSSQFYCGASGDCQGGNDGDICAAGEICNGSGSCQLSCQSGLLDCNGTCIDPNSNPTYCGASSTCQGANDGDVCTGSQACVGGSCQDLECLPWNIDVFPIAIPGSPAIGDLSFDGNGDLLFSASMDEDLYRIDRITGTPTLLTSNVVTTRLDSVAYNAADGQIYTMSYSGEIHRIDADGTNPALLATLSGITNAIIMAPAGFGAFAGQLIVCGDAITAVNLTNGSTTVVGTPSSRASDCVFNAAGTSLLLAHYNSGRIDTMNAAGTVGTFVTTFSGPDGLALDPAGRLFVANSRTDAVYSVSIPGGVVTNLGSYNFNGGSATTGLAYNTCGGVLIMQVTAGSGVALEALAL